MVKIKFTENFKLFFKNKIGGWKLKKSKYNL